MPEYIQVFTTTSSREEAERIARVVVDKRLAGCVQIIGPIISFYWWRGKVERDEEWLCIMKSKAELFRELEVEIHKNHSYEVPEIIAVPIVLGSETYINWLERELKKQ